MWRFHLEFIDKWVKACEQKPLLMRGLRQVGKTWLARETARRHKLQLIEINFERNPIFERAFEKGGAKEIVKELEIQLDASLLGVKTLLFLDEIQAAPKALKSLRWFCEEPIPGLRVIAAGSLLEFALGDKKLSMPVGRIQYCNIEAMNFKEYLLAHRQDRLATALEDWTLGQDFSHAVHDKALAWWRRYYFVGGMPAVVEADAVEENQAENQAEKCRQIQHDLLASFRDDFNKYSGRIDTHLLELVLTGAVQQMGQKFMASRIGDSLRSAHVNQALALLSRARLLNEIFYSNASALPLLAGCNPKFKKVILADVGLAYALMSGPAPVGREPWRKISDTIRGALSEQAVGQQLRTIFEPYEEARLCYWQREGKRSGEVDYLVQIGHEILPIEIKSGQAGSMKSLHQFMYDKKLKRAVRFDENPPSLQDLSLKTTQGNPVSYKLLSLPHYMSSWLGSIFSQVIEE